MNSIIFFPEKISWLKKLFQIFYIIIYYLLFFKPSSIFSLLSEPYSLNNALYKSPEIKESDINDKIIILNIEYVVLFRRNLIGGKIVITNIFEIIQK